MPDGEAEHERGPEEDVGEGPARQESEEQDDEHEEDRERHAVQEVGHEPSP